MTPTLEQSIPPLGITDSYERKVDRFIEPATLKNLSKIKPWRGLAQIALEWVAVGAAIWLCSRYWNPLLYIVTVMWIGARQNALAVLMHEAVHYRLVHNKKLNDWIGEVFTAWPVLVTVYSFRQNHWAHHRHVNQPEDPDWQRKQHDMFVYPKSGWDMLFITLKYWVGIYAIKEIGQMSKIGGTIPPLIKNLRLAFYLLVIAASIVFHFWLGLLVYWVVPLLTYFWWIVYVRGVAEHFGGIEHHEDLLQQTRHIETNLFERLFIAPNYIHVHIGHHLYPSVPFYNLKKLQELLMQNPDYASRAHVTHGYFGFLRELLSASPNTAEHHHA